MDMEQLIPGLPDDLARECLIRISYDFFPTAASVSRNWRKELQSSLFHRLRKDAGLTNQFMALVMSIPMQTNPDMTPYRLVLFDPATATWGKLIPFPDPLLRPPPLCLKLVADGRKLVAIGSQVPHKTSSNSKLAHVYDFATGAWRQGTCRGIGMPVFRSSWWLEGIEEEAVKVVEAKSCPRECVSLCIVDPRWKLKMKVPDHGGWRTIGVIPKKTGGYNYGQENVFLESDICTKENRKGSAVDDRGKDKPKVDGKKTHLKEEKHRLLNERKRQKQVRPSILVMPLIAKTDN